MVLVGAVVLVAWLALHPASGRAQAAGSALLTLVNPAEGVRSVTIRTGVLVGQGDVLRSLSVAAFDSVTVDLAVGAAAENFNAACARDCRGLGFAAAEGQRLIVALPPTGSAAPVRGDVHVVNEGPVRRQGVLRTGGVAGQGRTVLPFDLGPGQAAAVGVRVPAGRLLDLHLTCNGCLPRLLRLGNGIDLEIVLS